jgi:hypothetical protein
MILPVSVENVCGKHKLFGVEVDLFFIAASIPKPKLNKVMIMFFLFLLDFVLMHFNHLLSNEEPL